MKKIDKHPDLTELTAVWWWRWCLWESTDQKPMEYRVGQLLVKLQRRLEQEKKDRGQEVGGGKGGYFKVVQGRPQRQVT